MNRFDVRKVFSKLIFEESESILNGKFLGGVYIVNGEIKNKDYRSDGKWISYFPEIEELVEEFDLFWVAYSVYDGSYGKFFIQGKSGNNHVGFGFSDGEDLRALLKDIRDFKERTERRLRVLSSFLPDVEYSLSNESFIARFRFKIGFHEDFIKEYIRGNKRRLHPYCNLKSIGGLSIYYYRKMREEAIFCLYGLPRKKKGGVCIIESILPDEIELSLHPFFLSDVVKEIIESEEKNIKFLLKKLLLAGV